MNGLYKFTYKFNKALRPCDTDGCTNKFRPGAPNAKYCVKCRKKNKKIGTFRRPK